MERKMTEGLSDLETQRRRDRANGSDLFFIRSEPWGNKGQSDGDGETQ